MCGPSRKRPYGSRKAPQQPLLLSLSSTCNLNIALLLPPLVPARSVTAAWAGDSRAVLGLCKGERYIACALTSDHKPSRWARSGLCSGLHLTGDAGLGRQCSHQAPALGPRCCAAMQPEQRLLVAASCLVMRAFALLLHPPPARPFPAPTLPLLPPILPLAARWSAPASRQPAAGSCRP